MTRTSLSCFVGCMKHERSTTQRLLGQSKRAVRWNPDSKPFLSVGLYGKRALRITASMKSFKLTSRPSCANSSLEFTTRLMRLRCLRATSFGSLSCRTVNTGQVDCESDETLTTLFECNPTAAWQPIHAFVSVEQCASQIK